VDCPSCNIENKDDALLCAECGESWEIKISILCPKCNDENLNDIKNEALNIQEKVKNLTPVVQNKNSETQSANTASAVSADLTQASTSSDDVIYEVPKEDGFVARLTNFVKSVFSK